ncbi:TPA: hypothetical protein ACNV27_003991 [Citrobacter gillenii]
MNKLLLIVISIISLSGCAVISSEETLHSGVSTHSNFGLVKCATKTHPLLQKKAKVCRNVINDRISNGTMTQREYSEYESQLENNRINVTHLHQK